jgi:phosphoesterase RecJ-like protein
MMREVTVADIAARFPHEQHLLVTAHENPDGDALGCVVSIMLMAERFGLPCVGYIPGDAAFPPELEFLPLLDEISRGPFPAIAGGTAAYILDCATPGRLDPAGLSCAGACINIDHHQDNRGFGSHNLLDFSATSTTQIVFNIFRAGGFPIDADIATALYVGLVTDSGRFQYGNTTPEAHVMAAELQRAGVDVSAVYRELYENLPLPKVRLLQRALDRLELCLGGKLAVSWLTLEDFEETGAAESHTEGIIDTMRTVRGVRVAVLLRERCRGHEPEFKGSLRATDAGVNVADIAHLWGGGGHVQAAGFNAPGELHEILGRIEQETAKRL